jgi:hypothetical protein
VMELVRIIQDQDSLYGYRVTQDEEKATQLELLISMTKPANAYPEWHPLIATPFRYPSPPPHLQARFRPLYGKNIFYGSAIEETALFEYAFHFMKQRQFSVTTPAESGVRTIFIVDANNKGSVNIKNHNNISAIMNKNDYSASHQYIKSNPNQTFIIYPSCRDPQMRNNAAVLDIHHLEKFPKWESTIKFFYDYKLRRINWIDYKLHVDWSQVY